MIMPSHLPYSAACERNQEPILQVISPYLMRAKSVLEIGSGTGQHAVYFARKLPHLLWQASDQVHYLDGINAQLEYAGIENVSKPLPLDVNQATWLSSGQQFDAVYTANSLHIMSDADVEAFFAGLPNVVNQGAILIVYGPFTYAGQFTSDSNAAFDLSLRSRECGSSIKAFETVNMLAKKAGFQLIEDQQMPANNQCLVWRYSSGD